MSRNIPATEVHTAFRDAIVKAMQPFGEQLSGIEMLALTSHLVGQLIAVQDQRKYSPDALLAMVGNNIELGNKEVVDGLRNITGGTA